MSREAESEARQRVAECGCGQLRVTVQGEPTTVVACHCDYCQKSTGSVFKVSALFPAQSVIAIDGSTTVYNGLEVNGVGPKGAEDSSIEYHFCPTCGSTVYCTLSLFPELVAVSVGNFVDPEFPPPTSEVHTRWRHRWLPPLPDTNSHVDIGANVPRWRRSEE